MLMLLAATARSCTVDMQKKTDGPGEVLQGLTFPAGPVDVDLIVTTVIPAGAYPVLGLCAPSPSGGYPALSGGLSELDGETDSEDEEG